MTIVKAKIIREVGVTQIAVIAKEDSDRDPLGRVIMLAGGFRALWAKVGEQILLERTEGDDGRLHYRAVQSGTEKAAS